MASPRETATRQMNAQVKAWEAQVEAWGAAIRDYLDETEPEGPIRVMPALTEGLDRSRAALVWWETAATFKTQEPMEYSERIESDPTPDTSQDAQRCSREE